jgi:hypothetical protein
LSLLKGKKNEVIIRLIANIIIIVEFKFYIKLS